MPKKRARQEFRFCLRFDARGRHAASNTRRLNNSNEARPNICRSISLILFTTPSADPFDHSRESRRDLALQAHREFPQRGNATHLSFKHPRHEHLWLPIAQATRELQGQTSSGDDLWAAPLEARDHLTLLFVQIAVLAQQQPSEVPRGKPLIRALPRFPIWCDHRSKPLLASPAFDRLQRADVTLLLKLEPHGLRRPTAALRGSRWKWLFRASMTGLCCI